MPSSSNLHYLLSVQQARKGVATCIYHILTHYRFQLAWNVVTAIGHRSCEALEKPNNIVLHYNDSVRFPLVYLIHEKYMHAQSEWERVRCLYGQTAHSAHLLILHETRFCEETVLVGFATSSYEIW